jgi:serine/threonine protein kinase
LLTRLLQFDPSKRITSTEALKHPYFTNNNGITSPIITPAPTSAFFDLPIIPLSPFQIEEEYSQFNLLKRKSSIATSSVYNQPFADTNLLENNSLLPEENCSTLTRTSSFPNLYSLHSELDTRQIYPHHHHLCHHRHHEHGNTLQRSVSDLSIPFNNNNDLHHIITPSQDQKQQQPLQEKQKIKLKPINRFHFWGKKRITTT